MTTLLWIMIAILWPISIVALFIMFATTQEIDKESDLMDEDEKLEFNKNYARDLDNQK